MSVPVDLLEMSLGEDFGLLKGSGFEKTGDYFLHMTSPAGLFFNYADCGQRSWFHPSPAMYYLAAWRNDPGLLFTERQALERLAESADTEALLRSNTASNAVAVFNSESGPRIDFVSAMVELPRETGETTLKDSGTPPC